MSVNTSLFAWLGDRFTGSTVPLNLLSNSTYDFEITSDDNSYIPERFRIIFRQLVSNQIMTNRYLTAMLNVRNIDMEWKVENEKSNVLNGVEKSEYGVNFCNLAIINPNDTNRSNHIYQWQDKTPASGSNYYRISVTKSDSNIS